MASGGPAVRRSVVDMDTELVDVVGAKTAKSLAEKLQAETVSDLLGHYPRRYYRTGDPADLQDLPLDEYVTVFGQVEAVATWPPPGQVRYQRNSKRRLHRLTLVVGDGRRTVEVVLWNQPWLAKDLTKGTIGLFSGTTSRFNNKIQLSSPDYEILHSASDPRTGELHKDTVVIDMDEWADRLMPIYTGRPRLRPSAIRRSIETTLAVLDPLPEPVWPEALRRLGTCDLDTAIRQIHFPDSLEMVEQARARLRLEEALVVQVALARRRWDNRQLQAVRRPVRVGGSLERFDESLPFTLTAGQRRVGEELSVELDSPHPMHRLLQGDVGSGKTLVALRAMLQVIDSGAQAALMAPTEVLAHQHARSLRTLLGRLGSAGELDSDPEAIRIVTLSSGLSAAHRRQVLLEIASGSAGIVVGTHALLQPTVSFADLGFVVVDEQHRFGVEQRDVLRHKSADGSRPHTLVMTATPIPRTVAMTVFGDLETSVMTDLPPGRSPISTAIVPVADRPAWLQRAWDRVREEVVAGHQAYVVCPRIGDDAASTDEEQQDADAEGRRRPLAVLDVAATLSGSALAGLRVEILHGRLPAERKDAIMRRFAAGEIDVLVCTTVVEVGVDVPNATVMVIMDADRFGMSQLHQLRGRVGRGSAPGLCLLVTETPRRGDEEDRLAAVEATTDGFALAKADLRLRREGDILGSAQSGRRSSLRLLRLAQDADIILAARDIATELVSTDPNLTAHPELRAQVDSLLRVDASEYLAKG